MLSVPVIVLLAIIGFLVVCFVAALVTALCTRNGMRAGVNDSDAAAEGDTASGRRRAQHGDADASSTMEDAVERHLEKLAAEKANKTDDVPEDGGSRGAIVCAGGRGYMASVWPLLRQLKAYDIPTELWYFRGELDVEALADVREYATPRCVDECVQKPLQGTYSIQAAASRFSAFDTHILLDADVVLTRDPKPLFDLLIQGAHGCRAVFWTFQGEDVGCVRVMHRTTEQVASTMDTFFAYPHRHTLWRRAMMATRQEFLVVDTFGRCGQYRSSSATASSSSPRRAGRPNVRWNTQILRDQLGRTFALHRTTQRWADVEGAGTWDVVDGSASVSDASNCSSDDSQLQEFSAVYGKLESEVMDALRSVRGTAWYKRIDV